MLHFFLGHPVGRQHSSMGRQVHVFSSSLELNKKSSLKQHHLLLAVEEASSRCDGQKVNGELGQIVKQNLHGSSPFLHFDIECCSNRWKEWFNLRVKLKRLINSSHRCITSLHPNLFYWILSARLWWLIYVRIKGRDIFNCSFFCLKLSTLLHIFLFTTFFLKPLWLFDWEKKFRHIYINNFTCFHIFK